MSPWLTLFLFTTLIAAAAEPKPGLEAFANIQSGNARFAEGHAVHPDQDLPRRELVAKGQHPRAIVVSCSDSRVPPELVFDQGLGDLFVVRLAGGVVNAEAIASVEYAVANLHAPLLLVLGHDSCGAVEAAVKAKPGVSNGSLNLDLLVRGIRANLSDAALEAAAKDPTLHLAVKDTVDASLRALVQRSAIVRHAVAKGELVTGEAIYSLANGKTEFWDVGKDTEALEGTDKPVRREPKIKEEVIAPDFPKAKPARKKKAVAPALQ